jgi:hypothetical protein
MYGEAKKIHLIEAILKIEDDTILAEIETAINKSKLNIVGEKNFRALSGTWTNEEADEMKRIIENSCEQINIDDWK